MQRQQRIARELANLTASPPEGICIYSKTDNYIFEAKLTGPECSPYKGGVFTLDINVSEKYPFLPPLIKFSTKIYHPNIDSEGRICLDLLKMPPTGGWRPTIGLGGILIAIRMLLESPNTDDPLMHEIAAEYNKNKDKYLKKAQEFTKKYATSN